MTLTIPTAPRAAITTKDSPPKWMTLESSLNIMSDHYEWDPQSTTTPQFAVLNQEPGGTPIKTIKPFIWGSYRTLGERTLDDKIKLTITRVVEAGKSGNLRKVPLKKVDFDLLHNKRFVLVDHRTGTSTEPREFLALEKSPGSAEIMFDLKSDFVVQRDKAHPETEERLRMIPWINNCYTLVQVKE